MDNVGKIWFNGHIFVFLIFEFVMVGINMEIVVVANQRISTS